MALTLVCLLAFMAGPAHVILDHHDPAAEHEGAHTDRGAPHDDHDVADHQLEVAAPRSAKLLSSDVHLAFVTAPASPVAPGRWTPLLPPPREPSPGSPATAPPPCRAPPHL
ncbi:MAG: hypothetical protein HZA54_13295 [Planctomycetes bacterium]|nr:hypothetical protein [Planctomycetota bacterium]